MTSRPARARGLKHKNEEQYRPKNTVAPRAGAWIETRATHWHGGRRTVAPRAGAWIETCERNAQGRDLERRAPRGRVD